MKNLCTLCPGRSRSCSGDRQFVRRVKYFNHSIFQPFNNIKQSTIQPFDHAAIYPNQPHRGLYVPGVLLEDNFLVSVGLEQRRLAHEEKELVYLRLSNLPHKQ